MDEFVEIILAIVITVIAADFAFRVIRYAITGRGGPEDPDAFFWFSTIGKVEPLEKRAGK